MRHFFQAKERKARTQEDNYAATNSQLPRRRWMGNVEKRSRLTDNGGRQAKRPLHTLPGKMSHMRCQTQVPAGHAGGSPHHTASRRVREGTPPVTLLPGEWTEMLCDRPWAAPARGTPAMSTWNHILVPPGGGWRTGAPTLRLGAGPWWRQREDGPRESFQAWGWLLGLVGGSRAWCFRLLGMGTVSPRAALSCSPVFIFCAHNTWHNLRSENTHLSSVKIYLHSYLCCSQVAWGACHFP